MASSTKTKPARAPLPVSNHQPAPYTGPSREEILALRKKHLNPGLITYYKEPICIVEGHMQSLGDEKGKQYLDGIAGIVTVSVGHCHPKITERVREQVGRLVHTTTIYLHPTVALYAREMAKRMPAKSGLEVTYFTNAGSESNDLAVLMARLHTGRHDILSLRNCYHGGSMSTLALTAVGTWKYAVPSLGGVKHVVPGYCYRCPFGLTYPACDLKCARSTEDVIRHETCGEIAGFIGEPIQGVGGSVCPPPEYFKIVYDIVRKFGGVCIADEVQTGFGRTGEHYWGFQNWGVVPDMVTMAKGIGNGAPLGAVTTKADIAKPMGTRLHFNTFGGNPVSSIQGLTVLEIIDEEHIQQNAKTVGAHLKAKLLELQKKHPLIGEVRGIGLMLGVELVKDRKTKEPASAETATIAELAKDRGLLIGKGGLHGNVIRIKPPMCITKADCDFLADCLDECLEVATKRS
jgi:alanine-glyoxylate transaminase / (R)-3-amino-2-methylpropionate-pyruvate transaminase